MVTVPNKADPAKKAIWLTVAPVAEFVARMVPAQGAAKIVPLVGEIIATVGGTLVLTMTVPSCWEP